MSLLVESSNVLVKQTLGSSPHGRRLSLRKLQKRRQQSLGKGLGSLSGQKRWQMVNGTHAELGAIGGLDEHGGLVKGGGHSVHGHGVVGVGGVGRHVDNDRQLSALLVEQIVVDKGGDGLRQVDAVDEDIGIGNLLEGAALLGLVHVPSHNVLLGDSDLSHQVNGTGSTSAKGTNHQHLGELGALLGGGSNVLLDLGNQLALVGVGRDAWQVLGVGVGLLEGPGLHADGSAGKSGVEAKSGNSSSAVVLQELEVVQSSVSGGESAENVLPAALVLVAVGKLDVLVGEGEGVLGELLEANNETVLGGRHPRALLDEGGANVGKLVVVKDSQTRLLDVDLESGVQELSGGGGGERRSVLERLGLGSEMQLDGGRHCVCVWFCESKSVC